MQPRQNKVKSSNSPPLCMQPQRPVLESLRLPSPVMLPQPGVTSTSYLPTPCSILSETCSIDEFYCNAETCCSSASWVKMQPEFCPFIKKGSRSCITPCRACQLRKREETCKGPCRAEPPPNSTICTPPFCKTMDAGTDAAIRFYVDRQTSAQSIAAQCQSMPCISNLQFGERRVGVQDSPAQMSSEVPLCCRPQANALPASTLSGNFMHKSGASSNVLSHSSSLIGTGSMRNPWCPFTDASMQPPPICPTPPISPALATRQSNGIGSGTCQKLAVGTFSNKDKKRKKSDTPIDAATGTCNHVLCPANLSECPCRFPPAFGHYECTGTIGGTCNCAQNK